MEDKENKPEEMDKAVNAVSPEVMGKGWKRAMETVS